MTDTHTETSSDWRRWARLAVTIGAMIVSIGGQVETISPRIGVPLAFIFAVANDVGAILALDCAVETKGAKGRSIRVWAWATVLLAAGSGGFLNGWHAIGGVPSETEPYPIPLGLIIGVEPVVLLLVLTRLDSLVAVARQTASSAGTATASSDREVRTASTRREDREPAAAAPRVPTASSVSPTASLAAAPAAETASSTASFVATTGSADREQAPARAVSSRSVAAATTDRSPVVRQPVTPGPSPVEGMLGPRPDWMTVELITAVVAAARAAGAPDKRYGEPRLRREHRLADGTELSSHQAQTVLRYIRDHKLLEAVA